MPSFSLHNPATGARCELDLERGRDYAVTVRTATELEVLTERLLQLRASHVADNFGGLVSNITILENIALPALYHRLASPRHVEQAIVAAFGECGVSAGEAEALCRKRPGDLGPFERRLAGFVRCLVLRPEVMIYSRFFEGITRPDMARAAALNPVFRAQRPDGTAIYLMLNDMPDLQPDCHRRHEL